MKAYVLITVRIGTVKEVVHHLRRAEKVVDASMTLGPYDAVAVVEVDSLDDLGRLLSSVIQPIPGVLETLTCMAAEV